MRFQNIELHGRYWYGDKQATVVELRPKAPTPGPSSNSVHVVLDGTTRPISLTPAHLQTDEQRAARERARGDKARRAAAILPELLRCFPEGQVTGETDAKGEIRLTVTTEAVSRIVAAAKAVDGDGAPSTLPGLVIWIGSRCRYMVSIVQNRLYVDGQPALCALLMDTEGAAKLVDALDRLDGPDTSDALSELFGD